MLLQLRRLLERYITDWANILLRMASNAHVQFIVSHHIISLCKAFRTLGTFVILLAGVRKSMLVQL